MHEAADRRMATRLSAGRLGQNLPDLQTANVECVIVLQLDVSCCTTGCCNAAANTGAQSLAAEKGKAVCTMLAGYLELEHSHWSPLAAVPYKFFDQTGTSPSW